MAGRHWRIVASEARGARAMRAEGRAASRAYLAHDRRTNRSLQRAAEVASSSRTRATMSRRVGARIGPLHRRAAHRRDPRSRRGRLPRQVDAAEDAGGAVWWSRPQTTSAASPTGSIGSPSSRGYWTAVPSRDYLRQATVATTSTCRPLTALKVLAQLTDTQERLLFALGRWAAYAAPQSRKCCDGVMSTGRQAVSVTAPRRKGTKAMGDARCRSSPS